jgi:hypothetical protein
LVCDDVGGLIAQATMLLLCLVHGLFESYGGIGPLVKGHANLGGEIPPPPLEC